MRILQTGKVLKKKSDGPVPSLLWAAGFNFSRSKHLLEEVPYDPLPFLFFGEEIAMAVGNSWQACKATVSIDV